MHHTNQYRDFNTSQTSNCRHPMCLLNLSCSQVVAYYYQITDISVHIVNSVNTPLHMHTELCTQVQPSCICNVSHNPSCTCMIPTHSRLLKPQVRLSSLVRCKEFSSSLVNVCAFVGPVIQQDDKPLNGMYNIFLHVTWCT